MPRASADLSRQAIGRRAFLLAGAAAALAGTIPARAMQGCFGDYLQHRGGARWTGTALGAPAELRIVGDCNETSRVLLDSAEAEIRRLDAIFSLYHEESAVSVLNQQGYLRAPPPELVMLLSQADRIHSLTDGAFDPSIQPLWELFSRTRGQPGEKALAEALSRVGWKQVRFDMQQVSLATPGAALSLNGIAQGFITDRIAELFLARRVQGALIKVGEIRVIGRNENDLPWRVGVADDESMQPDSYLELEDMAVATSAHRASSFDGVASHILDPRTGRPANPFWQRVSAVHPSAALCDGVSTAALLMNAGALDRLASAVEGLRVHAISSTGELYCFGSASGSAGVSPECARTQIDQSS